jgi:phosphoglycerate dehydrogenase-like enzyme
MCCLGLFVSKPRIPSILLHFYFLPHFEMPFFNTKEAIPKVLVPEKLSPDGLALLQSCLDVDERKGLTPEELLKIIPDYDALLIRSETKVTAAVLHAARRLRVVARAGVGVDNVGQLQPPAKGERG